MTDKDLILRLMKSSRYTTSIYVSYRHTHPLNQKLHVCWTCDFKFGGRLGHTIPLTYPSLLAQGILLLLARDILILKDFVVEIIIVITIINILFTPMHDSRGVRLTARVENLVEIREGGWNLLITSVILLLYL